MKKRKPLTAEEQAAMDKHFAVRTSIKTALTEAGHTAMNMEGGQAGWCVGPSTDSKGWDIMWDDGLTDTPPPDPRTYLEGLLPALQGFNVYWSEVPSGELCLYVHDDPEPCDPE